jgi:hypothetical protein
MGITLTCLPPIYISRWICEDCGFEGEDRNQESTDNYFKYEEIKQKFESKSKSK